MKTVTDKPTDAVWPPAPGDEPNKPLALHERPAVREFVKFCIVGASSSIINFSVYNVCLYKAHFQIVQAIVVSFLIAVLNGFIWNRAWTFKAKRGRSAANQYAKFVLVNIVGLLLNTTITVAVIAFLMPHSAGVQFDHLFFNILSGHKGSYPKLISNGALLAATCVVVFWNYFANRHWTFKH